MSSEDKQGTEGVGFRLGVEAGKAESAGFYRRSVVALYRAIGFDEGECRSCGRKVWWVETKNGKRAPYTVDGVSHFADCPSAGQHRKTR